MLWDFKTKWSCVSNKMILSGSDFEMLQQFNCTILFLDNKKNNRCIAKHNIAKKKTLTTTKH